MVVILGDRGNWWVIISVLQICYNAPGTFYYMNKAKLLSYFKCLNNLHGPLVWENNLRYVTEERISRISLKLSQTSRNLPNFHLKWIDTDCGSEIVLPGNPSDHNVWVQVCDIVAGKVSKREYLGWEMPKSLPSPWGTLVS